MLVLVWIANCTFGDSLRKGAKILTCNTPEEFKTVYDLRHYNDVIMSAMASQITSLTIVYSTVYSGADQRKHQSSASLAFVGNSPVTGEFPSQRASNAENVSIWWRHHGRTVSGAVCVFATTAVPWAHIYFEWLYIVYFYLDRGYSKLYLRRCGQHLRKAY